MLENFLREPTVVMNLLRYPRASLSLSISSLEATNRFLRIAGLKTPGKQLEMWLGLLHDFVLEFPMLIILQDYFGADSLSLRIVPLEATNGFSEIPGEEMQGK